MSPSKPKDERSSAMPAGTARDSFVPVRPAVRAKALPRRAPGHLTPQYLEAKRAAAAIWGDALSQMPQDVNHESWARRTGVSSKHSKVCADPETGRTMNMGGVLAADYRLARQVLRQMLAWLDDRAAAPGLTPAAHVAALAQAVGEFARVAQGSREERVPALRAVESAVLDALRDELRGAA